MKNRKRRKACLAILGHDGAVVDLREFPTSRAIFESIPPWRFRVDPDTDAVFVRFGRERSLEPDEDYPRRVNIYDENGYHLAGNDVLERLKARNAELESIATPVFGWRRGGRLGREAAFRGGPVPGTGRIGHFRRFRRPKTQQERRAAGEGGDLVRARRNAANLPTNYDDIFRNEDRSWKKHRRTQYRSR